MRAVSGLAEREGLIRRCTAHPCGASAEPTSAPTLARWLSNPGEASHHTHLTNKNRHVGGFWFGGEGGIRTLGTLLTYTHFPGVLLQPLGHLSK